MRQHAQQDWLQAYMLESVRRNLCTEIYCTTCGAMEFRKGLLASHGAAVGHQHNFPMGQESAIAIGAALTQVHPVEGKEPAFERAVRNVLYEIWCTLGEEVADREVWRVLDGKWAGAVLAGMKAHFQARLEARRRHDEEIASDTDRREREQRLRQEKHAQRLALKKDRDRIWRETHHQDRP